MALALAALAPIATAEVELGPVGWAALGATAVGTGIFGLVNFVSSAIKRREVSSKNINETNQYIKDIIAQENDIQASLDKLNNYKYGTSESQQALQQFNQLQIDAYTQALADIQILKTFQDGNGNVLKAQGLGASGALSTITRDSNQMRNILNELKRIGIWSAGDLFQTMGNYYFDNFETNKPSSTTEIVNGTGILTGTKTGTITTTPTGTIEITIYPPNTTTPPTQITIDQTIAQDTNDKLIQSLIAAGVLFPPQTPILTPTPTATPTATPTPLDPLNELRDKLDKLLKALLAILGAAGLAAFLRSLLGTQTATREEEDEDEKKKRKKRRKKKKKDDDDNKKKKKPNQPLKSIWYDTAKTSEWVDWIQFTFYRAQKDWNSDSTGTLRIMTKNGYIIDWKNVRRGTFSAMITWDTATGKGVGYRLWSQFWKKRIVNFDVYSFSIPKITEQQRRLSIIRELSNKKVKYY